MAIAEARAQRRVSAVGLGLSLMLLNLFWSVAAAELAAPEGRVILRINGNIGVTNVGDEAHFDRDMLKALGMKRVRTTTHWTEGMNEFEGVLVSQLLRAVGAGSQAFRAVALNHYAAEVKGLDFDKYPALLAMKMNGEQMSIRERGPIWLVLPESDFPELDQASLRFIWVWQLSSITVH